MEDSYAEDVDLDQDDGNQADVQNEQDNEKPTQPDLDDDNNQEERIESRRRLFNSITSIAEKMSKSSHSFRPKRAKPKFGDKPRIFTHFIALPVTDKRICKKLVDFQYKVEGFDGGKSIYDAWYAKESTFHFTVLMLPLHSEVSIHKSKKP